MELHPAEGAKVLQYFSLFRPGVDLVLSHQEQYNGSGYPRGLARDQIPLGARIIHVADALQAMTSDRVYRKAMSMDEAVRRLVAGSGSHFDPTVVDALLEVLKSQEMAVGVHEPDLVAEAVDKRQLPEEPRYVLGHGGVERPDPLPGRP